MRKLVLYILCGLFLSSCSRPLAKFNAPTASKHTAPVEITFENSSENADSYLWDFGDGNTSTEENPKYAYYLSGVYEVKLTAYKGKKKKTSKQSLFVKAPEACLVAMKTSLGDMVFSLSDLAPKHRDNFLKLADESYYEGLLFHRVIEGFMIQGGDPKSRGATKEQALGMGGPGYMVDAEFNTGLNHIKGALAAARNNNPKKASSGSQFYIVQGKKVNAQQLEQNELRVGFEYSEENKAKYLKLGGTPHLDMNYTVFGEMVSGWEVLDKIAGVETSRSDRPMEDVVIEKVIVIK